MMVSLEKAQHIGKIVIGSVVVKNMAYEKRVTIRFTLNNWDTFSDLEACWKESIGGTRQHPESDRFCFILSLPYPNWTGIVEFAVRYSVAGCIFWDNNNERNYTVLIKG